MLLFDACFPHLADCVGSRCEEDERILCHHRFNFQSHLVSSNGFLSAVELTDYQVVLYFLYLIRHNKVPNGRNAIYLIVTRDKSFLGAVKAELGRKKKKKKVEVGPNFVRIHNVTIYVENMESLPYGRGKHAYRKQLIERLNKRYGHKTS